MTYCTFTRTWWTANGEPQTGRKKIHRRGIPTQELARQYCREYNDTTGQLPANLKVGRKMEYSSE